MDVCPKGLIRKSDEIGKTGEFIVKFEDKENQCLGCSQCAIMCPEIAITEVYKE